LQVKVSYFYKSLLILNTNKCLSFQLVFNIGMDSGGLAKAITTYWTTTYELAISQPHQALPMISIAGIHHKIKNALSSGTAHSWLLKLGWNWKEVRKGIYKDGHEREDLRQYRNNIFLPRMAALKLRMMEWDE